MVPVLQRALPIVGSALGRKLGVQVEVSGQRACTDGERILIPAFDPECPEQEAKVWGFLSHEAAHVRYTDFGLDQSGSPLRHRLTNLLEDVRIEKAISREYPGTAFSLSEVVRQLVAEGRLSAPTVNDPPVKVLHDGLLMKLRYEILKQNALEQNAHAANQVMKQCFSKALLNGLNTLLAEVQNLQSTKEVQSLADQIIDLFKKRGDTPRTKESSPESEDAQQNENEEEKSQHPQSENSDSSDAQGETVDSKPTQENQNQSGQSEGVSGKTETPESTNAENECLVLKSILESTESDWPDDAFKAVAQDLESWSLQQGNGCSGISTTPEVGKITVSEADKQAGQVLLNKVKLESSRLAAQLTGLVQAKTLAHNRTGKHGAKLDGRRLHRAVLNDGRVFKQRSETLATNATVHISLDISASMGPRMELAREAVLALVIALKQINGVKITVSAYPGDKDDHVYTIIHGNEPLLHTAAILSMIDSHDSTPMATGLWHAVHEVLKAKVERRLILMITDGGPDLSHQGPVLDLIKRCDVSGIDVIGVGIASSFISKIFSKHIQISDVEQLKSQVLALLGIWFIF